VNRFSYPRNTRMFSAALSRSTNLPNRRLVASSIIATRYKLGPDLLATHAPMCPIGPVPHNSSAGAPSMNTGEVWLGNHAWIVCLWALRDYRDLAFRLTSRR
jgi:hypothetical protein